MKNIVRIFALSLVATGAFASFHTTQNSGRIVISPNVSAVPVPMCPPDDPNACHFGDSK